MESSAQGLRSHGNQLLEMLYIVWDADPELHLGEAIESDLNKKFPGIALIRLSANQMWLGRSNLIGISMNFGKWNIFGEHCIFCFRASCH